MTIHVVEYDLRPHVKERARGSSFYTPAKTKAFEEAVAKGWDGPKLEGPIQFDLDLYDDWFRVTLTEIDLPRNGLRGDIDNYVKSVCDGLNKVAFEDDKQITFMSAWFQEPF